MTTRRVIGVLGGMGPAATVDFLGKIVRATPAHCDQDHLPVILRQAPQIPDRASAILRGSDAPFAPMLAGLLSLQEAGADVLAMPCNTAHFWHARLARACQAPILHIVQAVERRLPPAGERFGLMATRGTIAAGVYPERFGDGRLILRPSDELQGLVDEAIAGVKAGLPQALVARKAEAAATLFLEAGVAVVILACTELPLALASSPLMSLSIDSTQALAEACVEAAMEPVALAPS